MKFCPWPPFELIDVFSGSVGTDGARTRSFRLDRAVLWPIELQSQGKEIRDLAEILILYLRIEYFSRARGFYRGLYVVDWRICGPSWIWTSVDILSTNLQSVPINRSGIDPDPGVRLLAIRDQLPFGVPYPQGKSNPRCLLERERSSPLDDGGPLASKSW